VAAGANTGGGWFTIFGAGMVVVAVVTGAAAGVAEPKYVVAGATCGSGGFTMCGA